MAGELFIADKATLDVVNTKVGNSNDTDATTVVGSIMGKLNKNIEDLNTLSAIMTDERGKSIDDIKEKVNSILINDERKGFTVDDLITNKKYVMKTVALPSSTTLASVLETTAKGYLYLAVMSYGGDEYNSNTMELVVTVDDVVICNKKIVNPVETNTTGIITADSLMRGYAGNMYMAPTGNTQFSFAPNTTVELPSSTQSTTPAIIYLPKPVRINSSIKIEGRTSGSFTQYCSFIYELD